MKYICHECSDISGFDDKDDYTNCEKCKNIFCEDCRSVGGFYTGDNGDYVCEDCEAKIDRKGAKWKTK